MYIVLIGFISLAIVSLAMFLYNMVLLSNTGMLFFPEWLTDTKNSGALQAIGSIVQAMAAIFTFGVMVYLGLEQNKMAKEQTRLAEEQKEMTRRQVNLSLYKKRYKIRNECIGFLDDLINVILPNEYEEYKRRYNKKYVEGILDKISGNILSSNIEKYYLLPEEDIRKLNDIENLKLKMMSYINPNISDIEYDECKIQLCYIQNELRILQKQLDEDFKDMLDFRKI